MQLRGDQLEMIGAVQKGSDLAVVSDTCQLARFPPY